MGGHGAHPPPPAARFRSLFCRGDAGLPAVWHLSADPRCFTVSSRHTAADDCDARSAPVGRDGQARDRDRSRVRPAAACGARKTPPRKTHSTRLQALAFSLSARFPCLAHQLHLRLHPLQSKDRTSRLRLLRQLDRSKDGGSADCATDAFVSQFGVSWVDLSAGPFTWGPVVTSSDPLSGLRGNRSLPSVAAAFSTLPAAAAPQSTRAELEAALEELADQRFAEARRRNSHPFLPSPLAPSSLSSPHSRVTSTQHRAYVCFAFRFHRVDGRGGRG